MTFTVHLFRFRHTCKTFNILTALYFIMTTFTHINSQGEANMVDVSAKAETVREARARIAGIQAAKRTWELIPLCHPLLLSKVEVNLEPLLETNQVRIQSLCKLTGKTGVEMEALTAASVAALTIYDMCKAVQKDMVIEHVRLLEKSGGKSGHFIAEEK